MNARFSIGRSLVATGALLGIVSCSGGSGGQSTAVVPAVPAAAVVAAAPAPSGAALAGDVGIDATELASLATPLTSDVAPVGDATETSEYGWTLVGSYHGLINGFFGKSEQKGGITFDIDRTGTSISGSGTARSGQAVPAVTISGTVVAEYPHSVGVDMTLISTSMTTGTSCTYTGTARRYPLVFLGVLRSADCGGVVFFKVHPVTTTN